MLQTKALLFTILAVVGALYFAAAEVLLQGFWRVEVCSLQRQTNLVKDSFAIDRDALRALARETSASTALYNFVNRSDDRFANTELSRAKVDSEDLDFLALVNTEGQVVFSQTSSLPDPEQLRMLQHIRSYFKPGNPLLRHPTVHDWVNCPSTS